MKSTDKASLTKPASRREFLRASGGGLGAIALSAMLDAQQLSASSSLNSATQFASHPPKAKRVIELFMAGAASHIDLTSNQR